MINAYYEGLRDGVKQYAHWKDGVQYVGTTGRTLRDAISSIDAMEQAALDALESRREIQQNLGYSRVGQDAFKRG